MSESSFAVQPIGFVHSSRTEVADDFWGGLVSEIELCQHVPVESLDGLEEFSHIEVIFVFNRVSPDQVETGSRHPRNNAAWPKAGIFAHRAKRRPNRLGGTIVRLLGREGARLRVLELDAVDGTPVPDIKPVMIEFLPREQVRQPEYLRDLMHNYWRTESECAPRRDA